MNRDKFIKLGLPTEGHIESAFLALPLFRYHPNCVVQVPDSAHGRQVGDIFSGVCKVEYTSEFLPLTESLRLYGNLSKLEALKTEHVSKMYVDSFEMGHDNYIPFMRFKQEELEIAYKRLAKFNKPICITASCGGYHKNLDITKHQLMMPIEKWEKIVSQLRADGHDVLLFTNARNYVPVSGCIPMIDFTLREMCAMFKMAGVYVGIESGLFHGAVASGAVCIQLIPYHNQPNKFYARNYVYRHELWKYESPRVVAHSFDELDAAIDKIKMATKFYRE